MNRVIVRRSLRQHYFRNEYVRCRQRHDAKGHRERRIRGKELVQGHPLIVLLLLLQMLTAAAAHDWCGDGG